MKEYASQPSQLEFDRDIMSVAGLRIPTREEVETAIREGEVELGRAFDEARRRNSPITAEIMNRVYNI